MVVTAETFDHQLAFLRKHFSIVPLSSLVNPQSAIRNPQCSDLVNPQSAIRNPQFSARPLCAVTFDDGWRDNYEIAFPILQTHEVPATIFLTTDFIGTNRSFWHTRLMYVLLHAELSNLMRNYAVLQACPALVRHRLMSLFPMTDPPCSQDVDSVIEAVKETCDEDTIENLIRDLAYTGGVRRPLFSDRSFFLDWDQVCEMAAAGIEIGSHGCSHRILTRLKLEQAEDELIRSKAEIERRVGQEVRHFAFPDGAVNRSLMESAGRVGYQTACLSGSGSNEGRVGTPTLRRVGMHEGVSAGRNGSFSEGPLSFWLFRGPRMRLV
jgi:peptidoglycan/xylan/chitin deacetylase (PgdA/CDA1 family)